MEAKYNPTDIEQKWYQYWLDNKHFHSEPDAREPFTVVIPPPNVTGVLHMGHVLNETIQDILVRRARLEGKNACWVPGTDHASIATEAKVIKRLKEQGINKSDLTREQFLKHAWDWTDEHGGIILKQLRQLGCSCDWDRTSFTMDETRSQAVIAVFCDLYRKGLIYRGLRMVNWDPERQTALSDEEVIYHDEHSKFYYLKYNVVEEPGKYAVVATTRPETIFGDIAVCINPKEEKNQWLKGKHVVVPGVGRVIPIIEDRYVEIGFGTGCLKVTPAHDVNDYALGQKYNLKTIDIFTPDAHLNLKEVIDEMEGDRLQATGDRLDLKKFDGMDRFDCRKVIVEDLQALGLVEKIEDYDNKVGYSERTNVPIEPRLSLQWFIRMQHFADIALGPVMNDDIVFYPAKYKNTYRAWLENIKDWCISRQLWWGHRIPAYYDADILAQTGLENYPNDKIVVSETKPEGNYVQDEGALDTWFSSWLWPISLFLQNGNDITQSTIHHPTIGDSRTIHHPQSTIHHPQSTIHNPQLSYYYPTADLVTGPDIIFFWVARMIMAGYEYMGQMPFKHVYFTGIVRDKLGRKMSKSLGNSPDPLDLIERYGADGVRMGMMLCAPAGNDILFDDSLCEQGRNFNNKIWNCFRLVKGLEVVDKEQDAICKTATDWFGALLAKTDEEVSKLFKQYRLSEALMAIYKLFWDEFSSWYLEMIKPAYGQPIDKTTYDLTLQYFEYMLKLLHPFMPFITEELWHNIAPRKDGETIMYSSITLPLYSSTPLPPSSTPLLPYSSTPLLLSMEETKSIVVNLRAIRAAKNISPKETLTLVAPKPVSAIAAKLANITIQTPDTKHQTPDTKHQTPDTGTSFIIGTDEYFVPLDQFIDKDEEIKKLEADLAHQEGFLRGVMAKLNNERFVANAKPEVVELERKKQHDAEARIAAIKASLSALKA